MISDIDIMVEEPRTLEALGEIGKRYFYRRGDGVLEWKLAKGKVIRSQFIRDRKIITFIRDAEDQKLVIYVSERPTEYPIAVIMMNSALAGLDLPGRMRSTAWTTTEHQVVDNYMGKAKRSKSKKGKKDKGKKDDQKDKKLAMRVDTIED